MATENIIMKLVSLGSSSSHLILSSFGSCLQYLESCLGSRAVQLLKPILTKLGKSRQEAHEEIRVLSHQASDVVKKEGGNNDLIERIKRAEFFKEVWDEIDGMLDPKNFIGRYV